MIKMTTNYLEHVQFQRLDWLEIFTQTYKTSQQTKTETTWTCDLNCSVKLPQMNEMTTDYQVHVHSTEPHSLLALTVLYAMLNLL